MRALLATLTVLMALGTAVSAQTTQPDPPQPPYTDDPAVVKQLADLKPAFPE